VLKIAGSNTIVSADGEAFAIAIASRRLQSELQTLSFVSAVFVTVSVAAVAAIDVSKRNAETMTAMRTRA
jgi:hypothetical protein